jgi:hypothetical protein
VDRACNTYGGDRKCIQNFVGNPVRKKVLGRPMYRWEKRKYDGSVWIGFV